MSWRKLADGVFMCGHCRTAVNIPLGAQPEACRCGKSGSGGKCHVAGGPGTELHGLLRRWLRIGQDEDCGCRARMLRMDREGPDWCEAHTETIVGWLREAAGKRGRLFSERVARLLVRRAIKVARKKARAATAG